MQETFLVWSKINTTFNLVLSDGDNYQMIEDSVILQNHFSLVVKRLDPSLGQTWLKRSLLLLETDGFCQANEKEEMVNLINCTNYFLLPHPENPFIFLRTLLKQGCNLEKNTHTRVTQKNFLFVSKKL